MENSKKNPIKKIGKLALCGLTNSHIESLMIALSGGEAAKVRLCKIMM